ncbi:MAG: hypothetical protein AAB442_00635 [Patescibacteria group bacterium]
MIEKPLILVIVGVTGDLARQKLLPAIEAIAGAGVFPARTTILGTTRREGVTLDDLSPFVQEHLELFTLDTDDRAGYTRLAERLVALEEGEPAQRLFYMSVPPNAVSPIVTHMGAAGLAQPGTKLLLEKPFGTDLASATELITHVEQYFTAEQVYRIDHYLAKQMVQNLLSFRRETTWNNQSIERIEISAREIIGAKGRAHFYEQTGALRDVLQSHLLQLAALVLMRLDESVSIPERRTNALATLTLAPGAAIRRGQYRGYRDDVANPASTTETYVDLTLVSSAPEWQGVRVRLVTGKMLAEKDTAIHIRYKNDMAPEAAFTSTDPDAYEKVLVEALRSDHALFVSSAEVIESWRILAPVQERWARSSDDLFFYTPGDPTL